MLRNYKTAVITGGSSGIGLSLAYELLDYDMELYLVSENDIQLKTAHSDLLKKHPSAKVQIFCYDLSNMDQIHEFQNELDTNKISVDLLVNNAGFGAWGYLLDNALEKEETMISLMVNGTYKLTRSFLKDMIEKDHGCIVNVASIAAFQPNPTLATYGACKAWIYNWTRAIKEELMDQNSRVQCIAVCPTPVRTNFQKTAQMHESNLFDGPFTVEPQDVAKSIIKGINRNRSKIVPVFWLEVLQRFTLRLPESWRIMIGKSMLSRNHD